MKSHHLLAFAAILTAPAMLGAQSQRQAVFNTKKDVAAIRKVEEAIATSSILTG